MIWGTSAAKLVGWRLGYGSDDEADADDGHGNDKEDDGDDGDVGRTQLSVIAAVTVRHTVQQTLLSIQHNARLHVVAGRHRS